MSVVDGVRKDFTDRSELNFQNESPGLKELWQKAQDIREAMNNAKKAAAARAAEPFLAELEEIETSYALMLKLSI